jgi:hypothetical protein
MKLIEAVRKIFRAKSKRVVMVHNAPRGTINYVREIPKPPRRAHELKWDPAFEPGEIAISGMYLFGIEDLLGKLRSYDDVSAFYFDVLGLDSNGVAQYLYKDCIVTRSENPWEVDNALVMDHVIASYRYKSDFTTR